MNYFLKRLFDIFVALCVLIIFLPVWLVIIVLLKITGEGHVFYYQKRIGFKNKYFNIIKFATMLADSPNMGTGVITLRNDPRVTIVGKYLRSSKLNEFPQILNVLKGDMSIVGPRPLVDRTFNAYPEDMRNKVYASKPGITGIGSIVFRDEEEMISNATIPPHEFYKFSIAPYKGALELWYNNNKSFKMDMWIVFLTFWAILNSKSKLVYKVFKDIPSHQDYILNFERSTKNNSLDNNISNFLNN